MLSALKKYIAGFDDFFRLSREFLAHRAVVAWILGLGLLIALIQPVCLKLSQSIIDELQKGGNPTFFRSVPLLLVGVFLVSGLAKYFHNVLRRRLSEQVVIKLRTDLLNKYLEFPLAVSDSRKQGDLLSGIQNDLQQIASGLDTICDILKEPFLFLGLMGVAFYYDWQLAIITLVAAPVVALLFSRSGAAVKRYSGRNLEQFSQVISLSQESLSGARVVKVFHMEVPLKAKFKELHRQYFETLWKSIKVQELATPSVELVGAILMGGVILYGNYRISNGLLTTGELIAFILALGLAQMPIKKLNNAYLKMKNAEAASERIFSVLDMPNQMPSGLIKKTSFEREISFEDVGLRYGEKTALENLSFTVKRGECVAFVGPSGGGKSSVVNLLPRLYEVSTGAVRLDGVDLRDYDLDDLRKLFSFVTQEIFLFNDSIYENIRFGRPEATVAEIEKAAEQAHCLPFIDKNPEGFNALIGDRGVCLSGGERQRVAIARAFLKNAPILVLDEATSNLDTRSETIVQDALEHLMEGKTTFLVAHRLSTVRMADRIFVLEGGHIREDGAHETLLQSKGIYASLFNA